MDVRQRWIDNIQILGRQIDIRKIDRQILDRQIDIRQIDRYQIDRQILDRKIDIRQIERKIYIYIQVAKYIYIGRQIDISDKFRK